MSVCPKALEETHPVPEPHVDTAVFSCRDVTIATRDEPADWLASVQDKLTELLALPDNWNSYGARAVSRDAVARANEFAARLSYFVSVPEPAVGATPDGDVGFCWDVGSWSLDISIDASALISYVYLDERNHENDRDTRTRDIEQLIPLLTRWS